MIDNETLILFSYGDELDAHDQARVAAAIEADPALAQRWRLLRAQLDGLRVPADCQAPESARVRWRQALDGAAATGTGTPAAPYRGLAWLAALAAALVVGVGLGVRLAGPPDDVTPPLAAAGEAPSGQGAAPSAAPAAVAARLPLATVEGLSAYLQRGRADLLELTAAGGATDMRARAALLDELLVLTRAYERAAVAHDAADVARVLRAFEQSLGQLRREQGAPRDVRADAEQLSFEYAAMLTKLKRAASDHESTL